MPQRGRAYLSAMFYPVSTEVDGRRCKGEWTILLGDRICVRSGWGSLTVDCGRIRPEECARRTLAKIVRTYPQRRAAERKRQQAEIDRVNRFWDRQQKGLAE